MKKSLSILCLLFFGAFSFLSAQNMVTFQVDMSLYEEEFTTVYVGGSFNDWSADANPLADPDGDNIWSGTIDLPNGDHEYKFHADGWAAQEFLLQGSECTFSSFGFTNRIISVSESMTLPPVCWGDCLDCESVNVVDVTFQVDMNEYTGDFTTVYLSGTFNSWFGDFSPMSDADGDGVYEITMELAAGSYEYKFQVDNWSDQEVLGQGLDCSIFSAGFVNRFIEVEEPTVLDAVCWSSCVGCDDNSGPAAGDITFQVNMNDYEGEFTTVYVSGTFNNWFDTANPLSDPEGDGIWTTTINLPGGEFEYIFQVDAYADQEALPASASCTNTNPGNTNRALSVDGDQALETYCWNTCESCADLQLEDGNITFQVDMNEYAGEFSTVYVSGTFNEWSDDANALSDDDGDGIWTGTFLLPGGTYEYKFQVDAWTDQESLTAGSDCTITTETFTNRLTQVNGDADLGVVCWGSCTACGVGINDGNVSFAVDMNAYNGAFTTVFVSGSFNDWAGDANALSDDDGDGIWTGTFLLPGGTHEYKFQVDAWTDQEMLTPGSECTLTTGEFTNRIIEVDGDIALDTVCWGSCGDCLEGGNVTFAVDMNNYEETFSTVYLSGSFNNWAGDANALSDDDGDGIWTGTITLPSGTHEYKFQVDAWTDQEMLTPGSECTLTTGEFTNRIIEVNGDASLDVVCWGSCSTCLANGNITFQVDMSEYEEDFTTVYVSGTFNSWAGDANALSDDDGDGVWTTTLAIPGSTIEYKFQVDAWAADETLTPGDPCTITVDTFTNRIYEVAGDATLPAVCWGSCESCTVSNVELISKEALFDMFPNLTSDYTSVIFNDLYETKNLRVIDAVGQVVYQAQVNSQVRMFELDLSKLTSGLYFVQVHTNTSKMTKKLIKQ